MCDDGTKIGTMVVNRISLYVLHFRNRRHVGTRCVYWIWITVVTMAFRSQGSCRWTISSNIDLDRDFDQMRI